MSTVLLAVECALCELTHDVWGEERADGVVLVDPAKLRCPGCDQTAIASIEPREPLT